MPNELDSYRQVSPEEYQKWLDQSIRGQQVQFNGMRQDSRGNMMRELVVRDDEFSTSSEKDGWDYINWHRLNHKIVPVANCRICVQEQQFRTQNPDLVGKRISGKPRCKCGASFEQHVNGECP